MTMPIRRAAVGFFALGLVLVLAGCGGTSASPTAADAGFISGDGTLKVVAESLRKPAPAVQGRNLTGGVFDLAQQRGKVVVLNIWGSWCGPCRSEAPALQRANVALKDRGVEFVGLNTRDTDDPARAFIRNFGITYPNIADPKGQIQLGFSDTLPPAAIPSTLIIDRQGRVAARIIGPVDSQTTLTNLVDQVLASGR